MNLNHVTGGAKVPLLTAPKKKSVDRELVRNIAGKHSCDMLTAFILAGRDIVSDNDIPYFLSDDTALFRDPFLLPGIHDAIGRIVRALKNNEKTLVFGDRDVDGISGLVMLVEYLRSLGTDIAWRVPAGNEPYGLSVEAVEQCPDARVSLVITVDCGISGIAEVARANELGVDVIITDHHLPKETLPAAAAIVNPKLPGSSYPFHDIAGCVVAYKLVSALHDSLVKEGMAADSFNEAEYLQLAAIGTVADIMPLRDENRLVVRRGLNALMGKPRYGIAELLLLLGLSGKPVTTEELSWILCPALNSAGRMGQPEKAVNLLLENNPQTRIILAEEIKGLNEKRKRLGEKTWPLVQRLAEKTFTRFGQKLVVAAGEGISRGITGIMANRLMDKYRVPAMAVYLGENLAIGSIRSPGNYDISLLVEPLNDIILNYGGHKGALGFSMERSLWEQYASRLEIEIDGIELKPPKAVEEEAVDAELPRQYINPDVFAVVDRFEPYGEGNSPLLFYSRGLKIAGVSLLGKNRPKHVKFILDTGEHKWTAILWNNTGKADEIGSGDTVDLSYSFNRNWYRRIATPQIIINSIERSK